MGTLGFVDNKLAYEAINGVDMTPARLEQWSRALVRATEYETKYGLGIVARGKHPQTKAPFVCIPSKTAVTRVHNNIKTPRGYCCLNCDAKTDACWHSAAHMLQAEPDRASAILAESARLINERRLAADNAKRDAVLPATRKTTGPRIFR